MGERDNPPVLVYGWRWCPVKDDLVEWFDDQDFGCSWCPDDNGEPHPRLVLASDDIGTVPHD